MTALLLACWQVVKPHAVAVGACLGVGVGGFALGYHVGHPAAPVSVQVAHARTDTVRQLVQQTDTLVTTKTRVLARTDTAYRTIRDTVLQHVTDTVVVKQFVQACDSLKASCGAYRVAAQQKFHADSLFFGAQAQEIAAWKAQQPSLGHTIASRLLWLGVGLAVDRIAIHSGH